MRNGSVVTNKLSAALPDLFHLALGQLACRVDFFDAKIDCLNIHGLYEVKTLRDELIAILCRVCLFNERWQGEYC